MAQWVYTSNDPLTNQRWSKYLYVAFLQEVWFLRLASEGTGSAIQVLDDLQKHAGDKVTYGLSGLLTGAGVMGLNTLTGQEEAILTYADSLFVNELAHAVLLVGPMSHQRVIFDLRKVARERLADWYAARFDRAIALQLAGYTPQTDARFTGLNGTTVATRIVRPGTVTDSANLTTSHTFTIDLLDKAKLRAKALTTGIRPLRVDGRALYCVVMHPSQVKDMRTNTSTGQWLDIQKAAMTGGDVGENPIFWNSLGMHNGVLLHENARMPNAVSNAGAAVANTKRAVFFGAQAAALAWGRGHGFDTKFVWAEESRGYSRELGIAVSSIHGIKKSVFNNSDFAVIAIDTYGEDIETGSADAL